VEYEQWHAAVPAQILADPLWTTKAYRLASYLTACVSDDGAYLEATPGGRTILPQLALAVASIGSNIAEGYSRSGSRDRARFFEYALGSARESRHWYLSVRAIVGEDIIARRVDTLDEIIRLLVTMIIRQRPSRIPKKH
jgi:four helix bundle protein